MSPPPALSTTATGAMCEAVATAWLLGQGFAVFRNAAVSGPVDLIAMAPDGSPTLVDVKASRPGWATRALTDWQRAAGVRLLGVDPDTFKCDWLPDAGSITALDPRNCKRCGATFAPGRRNQVFCSSRCNSLFYIK